MNTKKSREIHIRQGKVPSITLPSTAAAACADLALAAGGVMAVHARLKQGIPRLSRGEDEAALPVLVLVLTLAVLMMGVVLTEARAGCATQGGGGGWKVDVALASDDGCF